MLRIIESILILVFLFSLISCNRISDKTDSVKKDIKELKNDYVDEPYDILVDKVFPRFDHDVPDTKSNKQRFKEFIQVELSSDIKNIYCFADNLGIDSDYMFAFNCNPETSQKIIDKHNLKLDTINTDNAFGIQHDFPWWDKDKIKELDKYSWTNGNEYYQYYWYDEDNQQAYYFDFDM